MIKLDTLAKILPQCCEMDSLHISLCLDSEVQSLKEFLPEFKTIVILAHHVKHALEWAWIPLESERNNVNCAADLHLKFECEKVVSALEKRGYHSLVIPYPGRCGIRFKDLANKSGLGKIGDNFMFLHKEWGTWTHLRVIVTDAEITDNLPPCEDVCNHCGNCKSSCPAKVIRDDILLGVECDEYQDKRNAYIGIEGNYVYKCEECVRACPIGTAPERINITKPGSKAKGCMLHE